MIDFSTLQGLTIPEGVVTQITDASGRVLWSAGGGKVILEVEKITNDTYAGETTYTGEQFILLDIYPETSGTVSVTYGGLTKTITDTSGAAEPNAQQVFFGTFNGVSDSVATPASGELAIEGDYYTFGVGSYNINKSTVAYCSCITAATDLGQLTYIKSNMFYDCQITSVTIPEGVTAIADNAFSNCGEMASCNISTSVTSIGKEAFSACYAWTNITIPSRVTSIGVRAFFGAKSWCRKTVTMLSENPPAIDVSSFTGDSNDYFNFIVPAGCGETYKSAENWSRHADHITEAS